MNLFYINSPLNLIICYSINKMICLFFTGFYCEGQTITPAVCIAGYYCLEGTQSEKQFPCPEGTYNPDQGKPTIDDIQ